MQKIVIFQRNSNFQDYIYMQNVLNLKLMQDRQNYSQLFFSMIFIIFNVSKQISKFSKTQIIQKISQKDKKMLFSFKEFEQTKNGLIKQFEQQPPIDIQALDSNQTIHEYNKLLNQIKYAKSNRKGISRFHLTSARTQRNTHNMPKSATSRKLNNMSKMVSDGTMRNSQTKQEVFQKQQERLRNIQLRSINNTMREDNVQNFYLTGICSARGSNEEQNLLRLSLNKEKDKYFTNVNAQTSSHQIQQIPNQDEENRQSKLDQNFQQLVDLRVKIFEFLKHQKYLYTQISEIQQSIRYFKGLNNDLQNKIEQQKKKHIIALNSVLKKQSDLNAVDGRNKYIKQKFQSTQRFFAKSLKSIQMNRNSESKKCTQMIDDITQRILTSKYLKQKIQQQKEQIKKLQQKNKYKNNRIQQSKNMHIYAEILLKVQNIINFIKNNHYGRMEQLQLINKQIQNKSKNKNVSMNMINNIDNMMSSRVHTPSKNNERNDKKKDKQFQQTNFLKLTKQLLKVYAKLTSDEQRLKQTYEYKINQLQSDRINLYNYCTQNSKLSFIETNQDTIANANKNTINHKKILQVSAYSREFQQQMQTLQSNIKQQKNKLKQLCIKKYNKWNYTDKLAQKAELEQVMSKQQQKLKKINETLLSIEDRCKFFIKKQIRYLQNIIQKWLKFDQSAINFLIQIINRFVKIQTRTKQQLSFPQSKDILIQFFENWQHYIFFIEQLHGNPFLSGCLCKNKLKQKLKRIIKTKLKHPHVSTQRIMLRCLKQYNVQRVQKNVQTIQILITLGLEIFQYASKYQVLIVNSCDTGESGNANGNVDGGIQNINNKKMNDDGNNQAGLGMGNGQSMYGSRNESNQRMNILQQMLSMSQDKQKPINKPSQNNPLHPKPYNHAHTHNSNRATPKSTSNAHQHRNTQALKQINHVSSSLQEQAIPQNQLGLYEQSSQDDGSGILLAKKQRQKEQDVPALVNLILAYQYELNKLPRMVNGNVVKAGAKCGH